MIWQLARVLARDADWLTLVFSRPENCARCARGEGCGAGVFARLFSRREMQLRLPAGPNVACGEWVRVGIRPGRLAAAAGLHYGLPLAGFLCGALAGHAAAPENGLRDLAALAGGIAGFVLAVRLVSRRIRPQLEPVVERLSCGSGDTKFSHSQSQSSQSQYRKQ